MRSFLLKEKVPINKWTLIPDETYFEGEIPEGYGLGICPHDPYVILDIDRHEGGENGFKNIPEEIYDELLKEHFTYPTKNHGMHIWLKYSGNKKLMNKPSGLGIDLRTSKGYVKFYLDGDIRDYKYLIKETSLELNQFLESLFCSGNKSK